MSALRRNLWFSTLIVLAICTGIYGQITENFDSAGTARTLLSVSMGALGLLSVILTPTFSTKKNLILAIAIPAIAVRLLVFPTAPSDDIHRYLWEGKLLSAGEDPYAVLADDPSRAPYHDAHWELMNHRDIPTAYPPLALTAFSWINQISYSPLSYKLVFTLLDLALIAALLALLEQHRKPLKWAAFYALSPLSFLAFSAEAHFDILMVLPLILGILAFSKRHFITAGICLALAIHFKLMVAVAIPFLIWRTPLKTWLAFGLTLVLPLIPFWSQLPVALHAVLHFGSIGSFNGASYQLLQLTVLDEPDLDKQRAIVNAITASLYFLTWWTIAYKYLTKSLSAIAAASAALATLVFLSPIVHFWYLAWIMPLVAFSPRASWLSLSVTSGLYFLVWQQLETTGVWTLPVYARILFWLPFLALSIWQALGRKRIFSTSSRVLLADQNSNISIVIPTRNAGVGLGLTLNSITSQSYPASEIIIVDAHSDDGSLDNLTDLNIIPSKLGRGIQIKTGVEAAASEWVLILHADAVLPPNALRTLEGHIKTNPSLVGGCLGQRFDSSGPGLLLVEFLNELRGLFAHTSFGDQAQFLHRPTALANNCVSDQPLMEDVELSDRLRPFGQISYLGTEVIVSAEKWRKYPFWKRFLLIVRYFFRYRLMLWKSTSQRKSLANELVQEYYSAANK